MTYEIATNDITMIPLNKLIPSGLNARKITTSAKSNAELRASLLAFGVLENLIVYGAGKDKYAVAAGERRRASLKLLLKEKKMRLKLSSPMILKVHFEMQCEISCCKLVLSHFQYFTKLDREKFN